MTLITWMRLNIPLHWVYRIGLSTGVTALVICAVFGADAFLFPYLLGCSIIHLFYGMVRTLAWLSVGTEEDEP